MLSTPNAATADALRGIAEPLKREFYAECNRLGILGDHTQFTSLQRWVASRKTPYFEYAFHTSPKGRRGDGPRVTEAAKAYFLAWVVACAGGAHTGVQHDAVHAVVVDAVAHDPALRRVVGANLSGRAVGADELYRKQRRQTDKTRGLVGVDEVPTGVLLALAQRLSRAMREGSFGTGGGVDADADADAATAGTKTKAKAKRGSGGTTSSTTENKKKKKKKSTAEGNPGPVGESPTGRITEEEIAAAERAHSLPLRPPHISAWAPPPTAGTRGVWKKTGPTPAPAQLLYKLEATGLPGSAGQLAAGSLAPEDTPAAFWRWVAAVDTHVRSKPPALRTRALGPNEPAVLKVLEEFRAFDFVAAHGAFLAADSEYATRTWAGSLRAATVLYARVLRALAGSRPLGSAAARNKETEACWEEAVAILESMSARTRRADGDDGDTAAVQLSRRGADRIDGVEGIGLKPLFAAYTRLPYIGDPSPELRAILAREGSTHAQSLRLLDLDGVPCSGAQYLALVWAMTSRARKKKAFYEPRRTLTEYLGRLIRAAGGSDVRYFGPHEGVLFAYIKDLGVTPGQCVMKAKQSPEWVAAVHATLCGIIRTGEPPAPHDIAAQRKMDLSSAAWRKVDHKANLTVCVGSMPFWGVPPPTFLKLLGVYRTEAGRRGSFLHMCRGLDAARVPYSAGQAKRAVELGPRPQSQASWVNWMRRVLAALGNDPDENAAAREQVAEQIGEHGAALVCAFVELRLTGTVLAAWTDAQRRACYDAMCEVIANGKLPDVDALRGELGLAGAGATGDGEGDQILATPSPDATAAVAAITTATNAPGIDMLRRVYPYYGLELHRMPFVGPPSLAQLGLMFSSGMQQTGARWVAQVDAVRVPFALEQALETTRVLPESHNHIHGNNTDTSSSQGEAMDDTRDADDPSAAVATAAAGGGESASASLSPIAWKAQLTTYLATSVLTAYTTPQPLAGFREWLRVLAAKIALRPKAEHLLWAGMHEQAWVRVLWRFAGGYLEAAKAEAPPRELPAATNAPRDMPCVEDPSPTSAAASTPVDTWLASMTDSDLMTLYLAMCSALDPAAAQSPPQPPEYTCLSTPSGSPQHAFARAIQRLTATGGDARVVWSGRLPCLPPAPGSPAPTTWECDLRRVLRPCHEYAEAHFTWLHTRSSWGLAKHGLRRGMKVWMGLVALEERGMPGSPPQVAAYMEHFETGRVVDTSHATAADAVQKWLSDFIAARQQLSADDLLLRYGACTPRLGSALDALASSPANATAPIFDALTLTELRVVYARLAHAVRDAAGVAGADGDAAAAAPATTAHYAHKGYTPEELAVLAAPAPAGDDGIGGAAGFDEEAVRVPHMGPPLNQEHARILADTWADVGARLAMLTRSGLPGTREQLEWLVEQRRLRSEQHNKAAYPAGVMSGTEAHVPGGDGDGGSHEAGKEALTLPGDDEFRAWLSRIGDAFCNATAAAALPAHGCLAPGVVDVLRRFGVGSAVAYRWDRRTLSMVHAAVCAAMREDAARDEDQIQSMQLKAGGGRRRVGRRDAATLLEVPAGQVADSPEALIQTHSTAGAATGRPLYGTRHPNALVDARHDRIACIDEHLSLQLVIALSAGDHYGRAALQESDVWVDAMRGTNATADGGVDDGDGGIDALEMHLYRRLGAYAPKATAA